MKTPMNDKIVYVTGGSSGIGFACADQFVRLGAHVLIIARDGKKLADAAAHLKNRCISEHQRIETLSLDVSKSEEVGRKIGTALSQFGIPHVLLNCAGIAHPDYFENLDPVIFEKTIAINLLGTVNMCSAVYPAMKKQGGHIINIASIAGFIGLFGYTAYSASKFAVIGFSEALRSEGKRYGIRVSVLCPPDTDTPQLAEEEKTKPAETKAISGNAKLMKPEQVAQRLVKAVGSNSFFILPGGSSKFIYVMKRLFPGFVEWMIDRDIRSGSVQKN